MSEIGVAGPGHGIPAGRALVTLSSQLSSCLSLE